LAVLTVIACHKTNYTIVDENDNGVVRLDYTNIELTFIKSTPNGDAAAIFNGTDNAIGVQVDIIGGMTQPILSDSWTFGGNCDIKEISFDWNETLDVKIAVYNTGVSSFTQTLIAGMSGNFWANLQDGWVYAAYEDTIVLTQPSNKMGVDGDRRFIFMIPDRGYNTVINDDSAQIIYPSLTHYQFKKE